jgi:dephospho-CoA kinase
MNKTLIILIGPKGSGKTYIGTLLEKRLKIPFFRVENVWLQLQEEKLSPSYLKKGYQNVNNEIDIQFTESNKLIIESTGTYNFKSFLNDLQDKYNVKLIKIFAEPDICLKRVKMRDQSLHVNVSDDIVIDINKKAFSVKLDFDLEIYNVNLNDNEIVRKFSFLI